MLVSLWKLLGVATTVIRPSQYSPVRYIRVVPRSQIKVWLRWMFGIVRGRVVGKTRYLMISRFCDFKVNDVRH